MENQELKTLILKEAGVFDKWDTEAALKLSENQLHQKLLEIRKRKNIGIGAFIFFSLCILFIIIDLKLKILPAEWFSPSSQMGVILVFLYFSFKGFARLPKEEYIYQLLLKIDKQQKESIAA